MNTIMSCQQLIVPGEFGRRVNGCGGVERDMLALGKVSEHASSDLLHGANQFRLIIVMWKNEADNIIFSNVSKKIL